MTIYAIKTVAGKIIKGNLSKESQPHFYIALNEPFDYVTTSKFRKTIKNGILLVNATEAYHKNHHLILTKSDHKLITKDSFIVFDKAVIYSIEDLTRAFNSHNNRLMLSEKVSKELLEKIREKFLSSNASKENKTYLQKYLEQKSDTENQPILRK